MIRAVIIDDEMKCRNTLLNHLDRYCPDVRVVGEADGVSTGVDLITSQRPDVVFLDIQLTDGNGFQILEAFPEIFFKVIFTTAFDQYALKAFDFSTLDYLLKPLEPEKLQKAVARVVTESKTTFDQKISVFRENQLHLEKIALPTSDGLKLVRIKDIVRCQSDSNYTFIILKGGEKYLVARTLREYEDLLAPLNFFRVHNSHLINMELIDRYVRGEGGTVIMEDGTEIEVSRRKKEHLLNYLLKR